jgi:chromosome segregation ATPase|tara:strand:- start:164 stop:601 length:438 start_codon:yes stop_codon:yes gene_type:complete
MNAEQISTWIGIAGALGGVAMTFATMEEKVAQLEGSMSELYNVEEIRVMERRLTTLEVTQSNSDVGRISATIATIQAEITNANQTIKRLESTISGLQSQDTSKIESGVSVNKSRISNLQSTIERLEGQIARLSSRLSNLNSNPLG